MLSVGIDIGGSSIKAWLYDSTSGALNEKSARTPVTRGPEYRVECDPHTLWSIVVSVINDVMNGAEVSTTPDAIVVTSLRQGFVLVDANEEIGPVVLNSDRRGENYLSVIRERIGADALYETTGHWLAPELTLPKILSVIDTEPDRWSRTQSVLFVHDWLVWRLTGERACEVSFACAGQLSDVRQRNWAWSLMSELGVDAKRFPPVVESGHLVGTLTSEVAHALPGLTSGTPVLAGGADTQMAALGVGGARAGVATVVAGSSTPVQAATESPLRDPLRRPWISTHLEPGLWAAETNVGYPGTMMDWLRGMPDTGSQWGDLSDTPGANGISAIVAHPHWTEEIWATKAPSAILGLRETTSPGDIARAFLEAHAFGVRSNVSDLSSALGAEMDEVMVIGGGAPFLGAIIADVLNRPVTMFTEMTSPAVLGVAQVVARAFGDDTTVLIPESVTVEPVATGTYDVAYELYLERYEMVHRNFLERVGQ